MPSTSVSRGLPGSKAHTMAWLLRNKSSAAFRALDSQPRAACRASVGSEKECAVVQSGRHQVVEKVRHLPDQKLRLEDPNEDPRTECAAAGRGELPGAKGHKRPFVGVEAGLAETEPRL